MGEMSNTKGGRVERVVMGRRQLLAGLAAGTVVACTTNPETGTSQFILISNDQLAQMSAGSWADIKRQERVSTNPRYNSQLQRVGSRITNAAGRGDQPWEYAVFDSEQVNAFVLPGRQVGFYTGLMDLADNEDQIATVMGHEVGHVTGRHAAERASQQLAFGAGIAAVDLAAQDSEYRGEIAAVLGLGVQFGILLPYSRRHELEADRLGVQYMARAGYQPREALRFWEKMAADGGGSRPPEYLSTHPAPDTRIRELDQYIRNMGYA